MNLLRSGLNLLLGLVILLTIAYLAICLFLFFRQNRLIFFPTPVLEARPSDLGLAYEDIWIPVGEIHHPLHSWWIPAAGETKGVVLHLHGNGYNIGANLSQAMQFHRLGLSVLMLDYRGYGLSKGDFPTEMTVYQDARAAWDYLTQTKQVPPDRIFLFGHSLGGAIAIDLAITLPTMAGLIVQSSFTSMRGMVDQMGHFWMFPIDLLLTHQFDSISKVPSLQTPVLYVHGTADTLIPSFMSERLYAASPEPRSLLLVPGANHNDVPEIGGEAYLQALKQFVENSLTRSIN